MSDLYDSLEDECDESKCKSGSPDEFKTPDCFENTSESESPKKYSFFLRGNSSENRKDFQLNKTLLSSREKIFFLPKIEKSSNDKGGKLVRNLDDQILIKQGLQLNNDGSITKSPRGEEEELPFINRDYRNLQFQKKKTFSDYKKVPSVSNQKKCNIKDIEKLENEISLKQSISVKRKKDSCEKIISGNPVSSDPSLLKSNKEFASNYNMTDSMKEKLLHVQKENLRNASLTIKNSKEANCEITSSETSSVLRPNKFSHEKAGDQTNNFHYTHRSQKNSTCLNSSQKQFKTSKPKIHGYLSDISLTTLRPKLNYLERHKLANGFNIFHLKELNKKVQSDSNRSNFGDSVIEELPEVSSGRVSCNESGREEESFYQKLIERDKSLKIQKQSHHSARSEGPVHVRQLKSLLEERKDLLRSRNLTKSMDIHLDIDVDNVVTTFKKIAHHCPANSSAKALKIELALKGKTYGYLANARNIFRLKAQSEKKLNAAGKEENLKIIENISPPSKKVSDLSRGNNKLSKHSSASIGIFPNLKGGLPRYLEKSSRGSKSFSKTKLSEVPNEIRKEFVLPQVHSQKGQHLKNPKE